MHVDGFRGDDLFHVAWGYDTGVVHFGGLHGGLYDPADASDRDFVPAGPRDSFGLWVQLPDSQIVYSVPKDNCGYSIPCFDAFRYLGNGYVAVRSDYVSGDIGTIRLENVEPVSSVPPTALLLAGAIAWLLSGRRRGHA